LVRQQGSSDIKIFKQDVKLQPSASENVCYADIRGIRGLKRSTAIRRMEGYYRSTVEFTYFAVVALPGAPLICLDVRHTEQNQKFGTWHLTERNKRYVTLDRATIYFHL
jgi:hypothetical protein